VSIGLRIGGTAAASGAALAIVIADSADPVAAGAAFSYTVSTGNAGPAVASSVSVVVTLDASLTFVSASGTGWTCNAVGQVVTCTRASLAVVTAPDITINVTAGNSSTTATTTGTIVASNGAIVTATPQTTSIVRPTMSATFVDAPDPAVTSTNFTYTFTLTNNGAGTINNISATFTLDNNVTWVSTSGTGWTLGHSGQTVTATLTSLAVGAANPVVITVTAPASAQSVTSSYSTTADNAATISGNAGTTINLVSKDGTSGIYTPATAAEWTNLGLTAPDLLWLMQEASGTLAETITGTVSLASSGTGLSYQNAVTGWSRKSLKTTSATAGRWSSTNSALPDVSTTSCLLLIYGQVITCDTNGRGFCQLGTTTSGRVDTVTTPTYRAVSAANTLTASNAATAVEPIVLKVDRTNSVVTMYTLSEKKTPTFGSTMTGKGLYVGGNASISSANQYLYGAAWTGSHGEMSDATVKSMLQTLGWTPTWT
jgi:uncharacterized repeat protein (TIGR01451 family)